MILLPRVPHPELFPVNWLASVAMLQDILQYNLLLTGYIARYSLINWLYREIFSYRGQFDDII